MKKLILLIIIASLGMACPAPDYPILFGINGKWQTSVNIRDGQTSAKITGSIRPYPEWVYLFVTIEIRGLPLSQLNSLNKKISFDSGPFKECNPSFHTYKNKVEVVFYSDFEHKSLSKMTSVEFNSYLDSIKAKVKIEEVLSKPCTIDIKINKELMIEKLTKWYRNPEN